MADRRPSRGSRPNPPGRGPGPKPGPKSSRPKSGGARTTGGGGPPRPADRRPPGPRASKPRTGAAGRQARPHDGGEERLQKVLAHAGLGSRRACEELITQGRVTVNGQVVNELGTRVDPKAKIAVDGEAVHGERLVYYAVHKPKGCVSTNNDPSGRPRVVDLLAEIPERVYTVGRLDEQSTGLILLMNDGELANKLAHPKFGVEKLYRVVVAGEPGREVFDKLIEGIWLSEGKVRAKRVKPVARRGQATVLEMTLAEGKNREIRRMLAKLGHKVMSLTRVAVGPVALKGLPVGEARPLTSREIELLRQVASGEYIPPPVAADRRPRLPRGTQPGSPRPEPVDQMDELRPPRRPAPPQRGLPPRPQAGPGRPGGRPRFDVAEEGGPTPRGPRAGAPGRPGPGPRPPYNAGGPPPRGRSDESGPPPRGPRAGAAGRPGPGPRPPYAAGGPPPRGRSDEAGPPPRGPRAGAPGRPGPGPRPPYNAGGPPPPRGRRADGAEGGRPPRPGQPPEPLGRPPRPRLYGHDQENEAGGPPPRPQGRPVRPPRPPGPGAGRPPGPRGRQQDEGVPPPPTPSVRRPARGNQDETPRRIIIGLNDDASSISGPIGPAGARRRPPKRAPRSSLGMKRTKPRDDGDKS